MITCGVGEIAKLRFPQDEGVGCNTSYPYSKPNTEASEGAVVYGEGGPRLAERCRGIGTARLRIVQDQVTLGEGAPLRVLPGHADGNPVRQDGGKAKASARDQSTFPPSPGLRPGEEGRSVSDTGGIPPACAAIPG